MDSATIAAGLLHDVVEDSHTSVEQLESLFSYEVAQLVDGVTKLSRTDFEAIEGTSEKEIQPDNKKKKQVELKRRAENLRKIFLAMARDVRVMIIKLADRTHNMWTLSALPEDRQRKIATETLQIYAPLAHRLGIWQIKWQLEDLAFKHLQPDEYADMVERVSRTRREREGDLEEVTRIAQERLKGAHIHATIQGRPKHLYSIYHKIKSQEIEFSEIYDLTAIRVIVNTVADCYHALGVVHDQWMPIPGKFSDYIAKPKSNMYQSLHTKVVGPRGEPLEIQIRTWDMHKTADFGIAAHWQYKEKSGADQHFERKLSWLRQQLFDWQNDAKDANEFLRSVIEDLFTDQVFVFTPKGDVIDLPAGSTPVDFAYRIHSGVGHTCVGGKVNGKIVPLSYEFRNGDIVEIMTRSNATPSLDWLGFAKTSHAKSKIKAWFRRLRHTENVNKGRDLLEKEAVRLGLDPSDLLKAEKLEKIAKLLNHVNSEDLCAAIGHGHIGAATVIGKLRAHEPPKDQITIGRTKVEGKLSITAGGVDDVFIRRSRCC
jgi:GTP pyrophosphokinase